MDCLESCLEPGPLPQAGSFGEVDEFVHAESRTSDDGSKRPSIEFLVVGDNYLAIRLIAAKNHMT